MKRSTKIISIILLFFLIIAIVITGRTMIGNHFKKKFSKRPPPGVIITEVVKKAEDPKSDKGVEISKLEKKEIMESIKNLEDKIMKIKITIDQK